jgi:hypothetical protein
MPWVPLCQERLSAKLICAEGPIKSPSQWDKLSAKPEFLVVLTYLPEFICRRYITLHSVVCRQSHRRFLGEMNPKQLTPILLAILLACLAFPAKSIYSLWHSIIYFCLEKNVMRSIDTDTAVAGEGERWWAGGDMETSSTGSIRWLPECRMGRRWLGAASLPSCCVWRLRANLAKRVATAAGHCLIPRHASGPSNSAGTPARLPH